MYQYRLALFAGAASVAGAFSGFLAFAIDFMNGDGGLEGWSWIFILEGIATIIAALIAFAVMVDYPDTAKFLSLEERAFIIEKQKCDATSDEDGHMVQQVWAAFTDWQVRIVLFLIYNSDAPVQVWALSLVQMMIVGPGYGITYFLPTIINDFGYSASISQLLTIPPYVLTTIVLLSFAHFSDKLKIRSPFIFAAQLIALTGYAINITAAPSGAKYFGMYLCVIGGISSTGNVSWLANNLGGRYKRAVGMALQITMGNFGGAIACNIFRTQDQPRYILGFAVEIVFLSIGLIAVPIIAFTYGRINARRDAASLQMNEEKRGVVWGGKRQLIGDRAQSFRYTI
ncbi:MFS general substrate transporter [Phlebopus sp. FC_14]|nr:MFS general substrate transporter [Phlebopus sp. FC_14]